MTGSGNRGLSTAARAWHRRLIGQLARFESPFREFGLCAGALYILGRGLQTISPRLNLYVYELMVQPIAAAPILPDRLSKSVVVRPIRRGDPETALMPVRPEVLESRFGQGATCLGAYRKEELIGYLWLNFDAYDEDEVRCRYLVHPAGRSVFDFDLYIFPDHRMGLAFVGIWNGANAFLRARGIEFTFSRLTRFNLASKRAHAHLGWKRVASAIFVQAWKVEIMLATVAPFLDATVRETSRTRLTLNATVLNAKSGGTGIQQ